MGEDRPVDRAAVALLAFALPAGAETSWGAQLLLPGTTSRIGLGAVLAHPESMVRGRTLPESGGLFGLGYHIAGPVLSAGVQ